MCQQAPYFSIVLWGCAFFSRIPIVFLWQGSLVHLLKGQACNQCHKFLLSSNSSLSAKLLTCPRVGKGQVCMKAKWRIILEVIPVFVAGRKQLGMFLLPLDGMYVCKNVHLIGHSPLGPFRTNETMINIQINVTRLGIPTGRRQTSWLFTSIAERLNSGLPRTTSAV